MNMKLLKRLCDRDGISFGTLERKTGLSANSIQKWYKHNPRIDTVMKVADYFEVTIDSLAREDAE